jgi:hypothetical protein
VSERYRKVEQNKIEPVKLSNLVVVDSCDTPLLWHTKVSLERIERGNLGGRHKRRKIGPVST